MDEFTHIKGVEYRKLRFGEEAKAGDYYLYGGAFVLLTEPIKSYQILAWHVPHYTLVFKTATELIDKERAKQHDRAYLGITGLVYAAQVMLDDNLEVDNLCWADRFRIAGVFVAEALDLQLDIERGVSRCDVVEAANDEDPDYSPQRSSNVKPVDPVADAETQTDVSLSAWASTQGFLSSGGLTDVLKDLRREMRVRFDVLSKK